MACRAGFHAPPENNIPKPVQDCELWVLTSPTPPGQLGGAKNVRVSALACREADVESADRRKGVFPSELTFGDMIPCPWRFSTVSSFGALPTRQGQGIVSPLHLKVIYGQRVSLLTLPWKIIIMVVSMNPFKIGERVIYPNQGLGVIEDIQQEAFNGESFKILHLRILANNTLVLVPSSSAEEIGIRKLISERAVKEIFDYMKTGEVEVSMNWKGRYKEHVNLMKSGTILDMVAVLKSLYYLSLIKPLSFREKKMMEKAKELVVSEISEASSLPSTQIERKIIHTLSACFKDVKSGVDI
jgi:CarD family transcriptional regulator